MTIALTPRTIGPMALSSIIHTSNRSMRVWRACLSSPQLITSLMARPFLAATTWPQWLLSTFQTTNTHIRATEAPLSLAMRDTRRRIWLLMVWRLQAREVTRDGHYALPVALWKKRAGRFRLDVQHASSNIVITSGWYGCNSLHS